VGGRKLTIPRRTPGGRCFLFPQAKVGDPGCGVFEEQSIRAVLSTGPCADQPESLCGNHILLCKFQYHDFGYRALSTSLNVAAGERIAVFRKFIDNEKTEGDIRMSSLYRFGVSLEQKLIDVFDAYIASENYRNRSEAIRDLIREKLIQKKRDENGLVAGAIVMSYDHHRHELVEKMMLIQHDYYENIISTQHVHLDHENCLEIIAVRGKSREVEALASKLKAFVGVTHVNVSITAFGVAAE